MSSLETKRGRRPSTNAVRAAPSNDSSPRNSPSISTSTGIPAFRSLRSLLPFGPHRQATPAVYSTISPAPNVSRSPFSHFGSMRRSMHRERKASFDDDIPPVISIDRFSKEELERPVRRSASYSRLEGPQAVHEGHSNPFDDHGHENAAISPVPHTPTLSSLPPVIPTPADLSTIIEADTSGISKHVQSPSRPPSPDIPLPSASSLLVKYDRGDPSHNPGTDASVLNLSTAGLTNEVLDAMMVKDSNAAKQWLNADKAVIIDEDNISLEIDQSFNFDALDPDLAALLSPPGGSYRRKNANLTIKPHLTTDCLSKELSTSLQTPLPNLTLTAPIPASSASPSFLGSSRSQLPRQQSYLPRKSSPSHSPILPHTSSPRPTAPSSSRSDSVDNDDDGDDTARIGLPSPHIQQHPPPSPLSASGASAPPSPALGAFSKAPPTSIPSPSSLSNSFLSRRLPSQPRSSKPFTPTMQAASHTQPPTSTFSRLKAPLVQSTPLARPPLLLRSTSSPEGDLAAPIPPFSSPSRSPSVFGPRPLLDPLTRGSSSFDYPRPSPSPAPPLHQSESETPARPSLDTLRGIGRDARGISSGRIGDSTSAAVLRSRGRSMSVQERLGQNIHSGRRPPSALIGRERRYDGEAGGVELGEQRPGSSSSERVGRRWDSYVDGGSVLADDGRPPTMEWLGPRTAKAFKAAGLMDFERDQHHERSSPGMISGFGAGPGVSGRYTPMKSASEYNPRAPSRMAFSEAGGSGISRRGSVSGTAYGLMESPTFTTSSGSRDRDTPRSVSTAPTSVSGFSLPFSGRDRDRERDREREDIQELKEKHATETGALLSALSDSQRTSRVLREENTELRDRLDQVEEENNALRAALEGLQRETGDLRMQVLKATSSAGGRFTGGMWGTPTRRSALGTPVHIHHESDDDHGGSFINGHNGNNLDAPLTQTYCSLNPASKDPNSYQHHHGDRPPIQAGPALSSTPATSRHRRRFSTTSSIFPVPPANMTMLLHDQERDTISLNGGASEDSLFSPSASTTMLMGDEIRTVNNDPNSSITSITNISPTTASFSMTTGSPGSLFLRPEHEVHLGDMDSLDLGSGGTQ